MQNITRRQAAKAITVGTAAAFVAPAALADSNPDTDILALARELERIETVVIPPLEKAHDKAEAMANKLTSPSMKPPRRTLEQIDAEEARDLARLSEQGRDGDVFRLVIAARFRDVDGETAVRQMHDADREYVRIYQDWKAARLHAENKAGLFNAEQAMDRAYDEAEAIRERIVNTPARTQAGYLVKLKIAMDGLHPDALADPEYVTDKALVSLMRDLEASV